MLRPISRGATALGGRRWIAPAAALVLSGCALPFDDARPVRCPPYCRRLDDHATGRAALAAARHQLKCMVESSGTRPSQDFAYGYEQAFMDVAGGASGAVPAVPPRSYWGDCYRTPEGHARAREWFAGYAAGAARAAECYHPYNVVATSDSMSGCATSPGSAWGSW